MTKLIAEIGSNWHPGEKQSLLDAIKCAEDCGADLAKVQLYASMNLAMRRGGRERYDELKKWSILDHFSWLAEKVEEECDIKMGASVFCPATACILGKESIGNSAISFMKTACQEFQWSMLCNEIHDLTVLTPANDLELLVSVPPDACLTVGEYRASKPIVWMHCVPEYPALASDYMTNLLHRMNRTLPGTVGVSDHTVHHEDNPPSSATEQVACSTMAFCADIVTHYEKHFCYDPKLMGKTPDGGPWSLLPDQFRELAKIIHGE